MTLQSSGTDIEEVSRFRNKKYSENKSFYKKIFTDDEIDYCLGKIDPYPHFTARFCAKEATIKALKNEKYLLKNIEIKLNNNKPILILPKLISSSVSLSHTENYAIAFVILN